MLWKQQQPQKTAKSHTISRYGSEFLLTLQSQSKNSSNGGMIFNIQKTNK